MRRILEAEEREIVAEVLKTRAIVFGILERNGKVHVEIVTNVKAKTTLLASTIKKVKNES